MVSFFKCYFLSPNKDIYRLIAREYDSTALQVYKLAHGKRGRNNKDYYIIKKLKEHGVLNVTFYK